MRVVGTKKERTITFSPSAEALKEAERFANGMRRLAPSPGYIPKGVYLFRSHEEANAFDLECLAKKMAKVAMERRHGK